MKLKFVFGAALLMLGLPIRAQGPCTLSGHINDESGEAVPFAQIQLGLSGPITQSGIDGGFTLTPVPCAKQIIRVHCLGYESVVDSADLFSVSELNLVLKSSVKNLEEVLVQAGRVEKEQAMAFNNMDAEQIKRFNLGQDAPMLLNQLTSVVANSDAGNGIGYTGLRIRGSDGTRVNVTINGVPVNDAESQATFFVNMPDLLSSVNSIQVQRGLGTSVNGAGAFGASLNFETQGLQEKAYAGYSGSAGSFNTFRNTLMAGTGLLDGKFALDMRASLITSDGYIDRASSDLRSYYLSAAYYKGNSVIKLINFLGREKTYQAWYYVPEDSIKAGNRTYNMAGAYTDANGNPAYYDNETDNYQQNNFQLHFIHRFSNHLHLNLTGHYTKGAGYYEQYRENDLLIDYGLNPVGFPGGDTIWSSDLIRQRWLDNDFAGAIFNLHYKSLPGLDFTLGGAYNEYIGRHFGRVIWAQYASNGEKNHEYYRNSADKSDANLYFKSNIRPYKGANLFVDLQLRSLSYEFLGFDANFEESMQRQSYLFFNPKLGFSQILNRGFSVYASAAIGHKEPNRDDFVQSSPQSRPEPEEMLDLEAGLNYSSANLDVALNAYAMEYRNQLVLNGAINDVGAYNRVNVPRSYRRGIELECTYRLSTWFRLSGNLSLSINKIEQYTEFTDSIYGGGLLYKQVQQNYQNTDISFSPASVSGLIFTFIPVKNLQVSLVNKNVSRQYLDNTQNLSRSIAPYSVFDLNVNYRLSPLKWPELELMLSVYNLFNADYLTNGYTYGYYYESAERSTYNFYAPAAPLNLLAGLRLKF